MLTPIEYIVEESFSRLDHFIQEKLPNISRAQMEKKIVAGDIAINALPVYKKNTPLKPGDTVSVIFHELAVSDYQPSQPLRKLYEDEHLIIIDKPANLSVHPGAGVKRETLMDILHFHYPHLLKFASEAENRPGIVHRLDHDTSGVIVVAKDLPSQLHLQNQFKTRTVDKTYVALIKGQMRYRNGTLQKPIIRNERKSTLFCVAPNPLAEGAREAITDYTVLWQSPEFSLVKIILHTGRTHQIRVHFSHEGNPVLGDNLYGKKAGALFPRLALHAYSLGFMHPVTQQRLLSRSPMPEIFRRHIQAAIRSEVR